MNTSSSPDQAETYLNNARCNAGQGPEWPPLGTTANLCSVGVVGAGTMGAGIALSSARAGLDTWLMDINPESLAKGLQRIHTSLDNAVKRHQMTEEDANVAWQHVHGTTLITDLTDMDVVVEAVFEDLNLKSRVLSQLGQCCTPKTLLTSNTSTLDIDHLAQASGRPDRFVGTHFLTPAHIVPLVEVVRGKHTSAQTLAQAGQWVQRLGKLPIQTANQWGFIGNRLFEAYLKEADAMVLGGIEPERIDRALEQFGMAMGPCRTVDMAGLDIADQVIQERSASLPAGYPASHRAVTRHLAAMGRLGVKSGRGHYVYEGKTPLSDPELPQLVTQWRQQLNLPTLGPMSDDEIVQRCISPLIKEGQSVLHTQVALRASDIDLVWVIGYGFPAKKGGPMFMGIQKEKLPKS